MRTRTDDFGMELRRLRWTLLDGNAPRETRRKARRHGLPRVLREAARARGTDQALIGTKMPSDRAPRLAGIFG